MRSDEWKELYTWTLRALAALYLCVMFLEGPGWLGPFRVLPSSFLFLTQCSGLFVNASRAAIEYRAEGYVCSKGEWEEVDTRPYFPIDADDKESRFQRVMFFYRNNKKTMTSLDRFLVRSHNEHVHDDGDARDEKIGGMRLFSIRTPLPKIGDPPVHVHRRSLAEIPEDWRKVFYQTKSAWVTERCFGRRPKEPVSPEPEEHPKDEPSKDDTPKEGQF
jgi:hypothetical protein